MQTAAHNPNPQQRAAFDRWKAEKSRARILHVQQRARERYDLTLTMSDIVEIEAAIALGDCKFVGGNRYRVEFRGRRMLVAAISGELATCLPVEAR